MAAPAAARSPAAPDADAERAALAVARLASPSASSSSPPALSPEVWRLLADSHAHPQLADYTVEEKARGNASSSSSSPFSAAASREAARQTLRRARASRVGCMSVGAGVDWHRVEALAEVDAEEKGGRIVPAFGIHPWWAHLHGARETRGGRGGEGVGGGSSGKQAEKKAEEDEGAEETMRSLLEAPDDASMEAALQAVARAAAEGRLGLYRGEEEQEEEQEGEGRRGATTTTAATATTAPPPAFPPVAPIPRRVWEPRLRALLLKHPAAIVGEVGLDRAAVIPGSGGGSGGGGKGGGASAAAARCAPRHQLALLGAQLSVAAAMGRPVSVHCVRAHGALYDVLRARALASAAAAKEAGAGGGARKDAAAAAEAAAASAAPAAAPRPPPRIESGLPPAVMMHSFGGPPDEVARFSGLEALSGRARCRVYFSFSAVINLRAPPPPPPPTGRERRRPGGGGGGRGSDGDDGGGGGDGNDGGGGGSGGQAPELPTPAARAAALKLALRIRAVPADRLLLESDQVAPEALDGGLAASLALVAAARGWSLEQGARTCRANFDAFYGAGG